jgi:hypothetical protein
VIRKERVTHENLPLVLSAIYVLDQCKRVKIGDVVTVAETDTGGLITVFHGDAEALVWENSGPIGMPDTLPSKKGTWIDATGAVIMEDGTMIDLDGNPIR